LRRICYTLNAEAGERKQIGLSDEGRQPSGVQASELTRLYERYGERWADTYVEWLGELNERLASRDWWAFTSTAKNMLSSPLGEAILQTLAVVEVARETPVSQLVVTGATPGQAHTLARRFGSRRLSAAIGATWSAAIVDLANLVRLAWHSGRVLRLHVWRSKSDLPEAQTCLMTYADAAFKDGGDAFFGTFSELLTDKTGESPLHLAVLQGPGHEVMNRLGQARRYQYSPLLDELKTGDVLRAAFNTARSIFSVGRFARNFRPIEGVDVAPVLTEALRWDLGRGGYFYNLLVYYAARRFGGRVSPSRLIYPFEMKSLEKMLVLGTRDGAPGCSLVGYQHTSITRRHTTFLMETGESARTPLPDFVVTVGEVTQRYLTERGGYPKGFFRVGGALRQVQRPLMQVRSSTGGTLRLLLALSSSRRELIEATNALCDLGKVRRDIEIGVRPHPEFPLSLLPAGLRESVNDRMKDLSGTPLAENLDWCDAVVYVSSTVALESLMVGKPVINLRVSDPVDPDPLLGDPPLRVKVKSAADLSQACDELLAWLSHDNLSDRTAASSYVRCYLRPLTPGDVDTFLEAKPLEGDARGAGNGVDR